ncbi:MAG: glycosyltransferase family 2 protein [Patescibacteria group bacterium]|nr:glycosyltransferase family 2 protein [Patescibacteria group bacterium]
MNNFDLTSYILELQKFGVGEFTEEEVAQKCREIRALIQKRPEVSSNPKVSVVIPAHKEEKYILATLKSLANQTFTDCEFIIVSNGEPERNKTRAIAEECGFKVIYEPRAGIALARQVGLEKACGEIIITTDADTWHSPLWIEKIIEFMDKHNVIAGSGMAYYVSKKLVSRIYRDCIIWGKSFRQWIGAYHSAGVYESNTFFRRQEALDAGGYDTNVTFCEGIVLFDRMLKGKKPTKAVPISNKDITVYTSGRRLDNQNVLHLFSLQVRTNIARLFGKSSNHKIKPEHYPEIR